MNERQDLGDFVYEFEEPIRLSRSLEKDPANSRDDVFNAARSIVARVYPDFLDSRIWNPEGQRDTWPSQTRKVDRFMAVVPRISVNGFSISVFLSLFLILSLTWSVARLDLTFPSLANSINAIVSRVVNPGVWYLDPIIYQGISALILFGIIYRICRNLGFMHRPSIFIGSFVLLILGVVSFGVGNFHLKPGLEFSRSVQFVPEVEPLLTEVAHNIAGVSFAIPSGFMLRQVVLFGALCWFLSEVVSVF